jgi:hypothetical protein
MAAATGAERLIYKGYFKARQDKNEIQKFWHQKHEYNSCQNLALNLSDATAFFRKSRSGSRIPEKI